VLGLPASVDVATWCETAESAGPDAIAIIRNIDSAESIERTRSRMCEVTEATDLPLVISGGFTPRNLDEVVEDEWSVLIVGGTFINAPDPSHVLTSVRNVIKKAQ
jgi:3-keto-L-gulonate-6-phosphate decarboxylase